MLARGYTTAGTCARCGVHSCEDMCLAGVQSTQLRGFVPAGGYTVAGLRALWGVRSCGALCGAGVKGAGKQNGGPFCSPGDRKRRGHVLAGGYTAPRICALQACKVHSCGALCSLGVNSCRDCPCWGVRSCGALCGAGVKGAGIQGGGRFC